MIKSIFDELPGDIPPAAALLGWNLLALDTDDPWIKIEFTGKNSFTSPSGFVQGGFLVAMLDEAMGSLITAVSGGTEFPTTITVSVDFIRPALPGKIIGEGRITKKGRKIAFLEGKLFAPDGKLLARSTASSKIISYPTEKKKNVIVS